MIYDSSAALIADNVKTTINKKPILIRNTLLDGSTHVQIIGSPETEIQFSTVLDITGKEAIELAYSTGDSISIETDDVSYSGILTGIVHTSRIAGMFELSGTLVVEAVV